MKTIGKLKWIMDPLRTVCDILFYKIFVSLSTVVSTKSIHHEREKERGRQRGRVGEGGSIKANSFLTNNVLSKHCTHTMNHINSQFHWFAAADWSSVPQVEQRQCGGSPRPHTLWSSLATPDTLTREKKKTYSGLLKSTVYKAPKKMAVKQSREIMKAE